MIAPNAASHHRDRTFQVIHLAGWRGKLPDKTKEEKVLWFFLARKNLFFKILAKDFL